MKSYEKIFIGVLGGLAAVCVKFLGQDFQSVITFAANLSADKILEYKIAYAVLTPILMFLGALAAWASDEDKKMKLIAIAVAAPALITTWSGGVKPELHAMLNYEIIGNVFAGDTTTKTKDFKIENPDELSNKTITERVVSSVKLFFGYGKEVQRYWVIVGSYKDRAKAEEFTDKLNKSDPNIDAWVGLKIAPNEYFPVIVGRYETLSTAKKLKEEALRNTFVSDAYLSAGANR